MDGLTGLHAPTLLIAARSIGLSVTATEGRLSVRGPKGAAGLARLLVSHKKAILSELDRGAESISRSKPIDSVKEALSALQGPKRTPWGTLVYSAPDAPPIEAFDPPPSIETSKREAEDDREVFEI